MVVFKEIFFSLLNYVYQNLRKKLPLFNFAHGKYDKRKKLYIFNWNCSILFLWTFFYLQKNWHVSQLFYSVWFYMSHFDRFRSGSIWRHSLVAQSKSVQSESIQFNPIWSDLFKFKYFEIRPSPMAMFCKYYSKYFIIRYDFNEQQKKDFRNWR